MTKPAWVWLAWVSGAMFAAACGGKIEVTPTDGGVAPVDPFVPREDPVSTEPTSPRPKPPAPPTTSPPKPTPPPPPPTAPGVDPSKPAIGATWEPAPIYIDRTGGECEGGPTYVQFSERYAKWVGVVLCSATRYKIVMSENRLGIYYEIADWAGHGQDHCELVNPSFSIPNEDDVTSGGCKDCDVGMAWWEAPAAASVYSRGQFGHPFEFGPWPEYNFYTSIWYECGVSIP